MDIPNLVKWREGGEARSALWRSERGAPPPRKIVVVDDRMTADDAFGLAGQGVGILWRGDFQNARQLLNAVATRVDRPRGPKNAPPAAGRPSPSPLGEGRGEGPELFNLERQARSQRARTLAMLLIPLEADYSIPLRRAPDIRDACMETYGAAQGASLVPLRELLGLIGAHEWRRKGIELPATGGKIHPHYGVFAPIRSEYVDLVAKAPLPAATKATSLAFDVGTGTGVLAAVLARRGIQRIVATDTDSRALACARENLDRLGFGARVEVMKADLFPGGRAPLVVCNPPWVPARPSSPLEHGIYDPESRMLKGFLKGLSAHLAPGGEGWLLLSDLAEHLGLRTREELTSAFEAAHLKVVDRVDVKPKHPRAADRDDALHRARSAEVTSLWRLSAYPE
ncbi:MAG TPA: class I SAM-dependent methyltransferase [Usitatibacter sp.]|nr:class I SAM-dependent methyltransferase [Usitatibacter sp.]